MRNEGLRRVKPKLFPATFYRYDACARIIDKLSNAGLDGVSLVVDMLATEEVGAIRVLADKTVPTTYEPVLVRRGV